MDKKKEKEAVWKAALAQLEETAHDFKERIADLKAVTIGDDNAESASQTESRRGSDLELLGSLVDQLENVQKDIELLGTMDLDETPHKEVKFGSVVHTPEHNLFVSTGIEEFKANGVNYLGISPRAPLYLAMAGATQGAKIAFKGTEHKLTEVF